MAKLAVLLFLFALCAVAMSARIAREESSEDPYPNSRLDDAFDELNEALKQVNDNLRERIGIIRDYNRRTY